MKTPSFGILKKPLWLRLYGAFIYFFYAYAMHVSANEFTYFASFIFSATVNTGLVLFLTKLVFYDEA